LNYKHCASNSLNGCINDVRNVEKFLYEKYRNQVVINSYTDDIDLVGTSALGIISNLYELALATHTSKIDLAYIHYSGHGSYIRDTNGDERDGKDEIIIPSDTESGAFVTDDTISRIFNCFNVNTKVIAVFDSCHSGTIGDLKYVWNSETPTIDNIKCEIPAKVMTISGCADTQTSADATFDNKYNGALTYNLLKVWREVPVSTMNAFIMLKELRNRLSKQQFTQLPQLCTSYNLTKDSQVLY